MVLSNQLEPLIHVLKKGNNGKKRSDIEKGMIEFGRQQDQLPGKHRYYGEKLKAGRHLAGQSGFDTECQIDQEKNGHAYQDQYVPADNRHS